MPKVQLEVDMIPRGERMNAFLAELKRSLGSLGDGIDVMDLSAFEKEFDGAIDSANELDDVIAQLEQRIKDLEEHGDESPFEKMFQFEAIEKGAEWLDKISEKGIEVRDSILNAGAATGKTGAELDQLKSRGEAAFKLGVGESVGEAIKALATADQQLGQFLNPQEIVQFTAAAQGIAQVWDKDVNEVISKSRTFIANFKVGGQEAANLVALGMRDASGAMDDVLDSLDEYSQLLSVAGFTAEEAIGLSTKAVQSGARDVDKAFDTAKESQIRLKEGLISSDLSGLSSPITAEIQKIVKAGEQGEISAKDVVFKSASMIEEAFSKGQISEKMRSQLQIAISGTPAEDLGTDLYGKIFGAPIDTEEVRRKAAEAGDAARGAVGPVTFFEGLQRDAEAFAASASATFAPYIGGAGSVLETVSKIGPGLSILDDKFGVFDKAGSLIKGKLLPGILSLIPGLGAQTAATGAATTATGVLNTTMLANPVFLIVAGIAALVGAYLLFSDSTKSVADATADANAAMQDLDATISASAAADKQKTELSSLADEYDRLKTATDPESQRRFAEVAQELSQKVPSAADAIDQFDENGRKVGETYRISTDDVRAFAEENAKMAAEAKQDALGALDDQAQGLADSLHETADKVTELRGERDKLAKEGLMGDDVQDDLKDVRKELTEHRKELNQAEASAKEVVKRYVEMGLSTEEIAKRTGLTVDEVKKYSPAIDQAKGSQDKLTASAGATKATVADLAAAYEKVKQAADSAYSNTFGAIRNLQEEQRSAQAELSKLNRTDLTTLADAQRQQVLQRKAFLEQRLKDLPKEIQEQTAAAKGALTEQRRLNRDETLLKLKLGEIDFSVTDLTEQAKSIRREIGDILFGMSNAAVADAIVAAKDQIDHELGNALAGIDGQIKATKAQIEANRKAGDPSKVIKGADALLSALEAKRAALERQAAAEKIRVEKELRDKQIAAYKEVLEQQQKARNDAAKSASDALAKQESKLVGDSDEVLNQRLDLRRRAIQEEVRSEVEGLVTSNEGYVKAYIELQDALTAVAGAKDDAARQTAQQQVAAALANLDAVRTTLLEEDASIQQVRDGFLSRVAESTVDLLEIRYQREEKALEKKHARETDLFKRTADETARIVQEASDMAVELAGQYVDRETERKLAALEDQHERLLISEEGYELEKTKIADASAREREAIQSRARGVQVEAERQAAIAELSLQQRQLEEKKKLAEDSGRTEDAKQIGEQLDDVKDQIETKGSLITGLAGDLQADITGVMEGLFAGDPERVKAPFRSAFQELAGALQQLAAAKITESLLTAIGPTGIAGLVASFALKPVITALVSGIMGPTLNNLLSFPTGGRVDTPTLFMAGDASRLGGLDREWITTDPQLAQIIDMASERSAARLVPLLEEIILAIRDQEGRFYVLQSDVAQGADAYNARQAARVVGAPKTGFGT